MILDAIKAASPQARLAGALISLALWILPAGVVWLYMSGKAGAQYDLGKAEAAQACAESQATALATAIEEARVEWEKTQGAIDARADKDAERIEADLAKARRQAARLSEELSRYANANPLPAGCRADPGRVELFNRARRGDPPEG